MSWVHVGKQVDGPVRWRPRFHIFGGCLFVNVWKYSLMVVIPNRFVTFCASIGIDLIGD